MNKTDQLFFAEFTSQYEKKDNKQNKVDPIYIRLEGGRCCRENKSEKVRAITEQREGYAFQ